MPFHMFNGHLVIFYKILFIFYSFGFSDLLFPRISLYVKNMSLC